MNEVEKKLTRAKIELITAHPFFGRIMMRLPLVAEKAHPQQQTMATDGTRIFYLPEFVEEATTNEIVYCLAHEAGHVMLLHHLRMGKRSSERWNRAADIALNSLLRLGGLEVPPNRFGATPDDTSSLGLPDGATAEKIYKALPEDPDPEGSDKGGGGGGATGPNTPGDDPGMVLPFPGTPEEADAHKEEMEVALETAIAAMKAAGKMPGGAEEIVRAQLRSEADFYAVLSRFASVAAPIDYSWDPPNMHYLSNGVVLPGMGGETLRMVFVRDSSGSMSADEMAEANAAFKSIMSAFPDGEFWFVDADTSVRSIVHVEDGSCPDLSKASGRGGTRFNPVVRRIVEKIGDDIDALVYASDMGFWDIDEMEEPPFPVLFARTNGGNKQAPQFGEIVDILPESKGG